MGRTRALRNVKEAELKDIPKLTKCGLVTAFKCVESVKMENVSKLGELEALKEMIVKQRRVEEEQRRKEEEEEKRRREIEEAAKRKAVIGSVNDWNQIDKTVGVIVVGDNCCNDSSIDLLDLGDCTYLKELTIGSKCFRYTNKVKLIGLKKLERVWIGENSLVKEYNGEATLDPSRHFYLKNCPKLKSLKMGGYSFSDYTVCEIENVDALEVIEFSELNETSLAFCSCSLELKSMIVTVE